MSVRQAEADPVIKAENSRAVRDTVEQRVKELIAGGQLGEDGRLPTERDLAEQFGVSRTRSSRKPTRRSAPTSRPYAPATSR